MKAGRYPLVGGPYQPPALRKSQLAFCLYRDAEVVVTLAANSYVTGQTVNVNGGWYMS
jgi:hypothetical protein